MGASTGLMRVLVLVGLNDGGSRCEVGKCLGKGVDCINWQAQLHIDFCGKQAIDNGRVGLVD